MNTAGYSGTPLAQKLGFEEGLRIFVKNAPEEYFEWIAPLPYNTSFHSTLVDKIDLAHVFVSQRPELESLLEELYDPISPDGMIWVSWHKKASKIPTEITEDVIREIALPMGLVDVKVCAVSDIWSGLKLVIRKELRD
ncbi:MAG: DUF3052 family protein [Aridibacter famidurans]|nr:DUF3052 family protein [Aridibacter famidurans]